MYYLNREQVDKRLAFIPLLVDACQELLGRNAEQQLVITFAEERVLHLAIETVTDIGSLLIDGFLMRDASSYEDIVEILYVEKVFPEHLIVPLMELVKLRRPLVQDYMELDREGHHPLLSQLPALLDQFTEAVTTFIDRELGTFK